ncbi:MAG TPA: MFS transporter [Novosphingobium sp.]|nr:MFS transporter [Novosphingobium sp.]
MPLASPQGTRTEPAAGRLRIGSIGFVPGITRREIGVFLLVMGLAQVLVGFANLMQPFIFAEITHIPAGERGRIAGELLTVQQAVLLVCVSLAGALSDRVGRKALLVCAVGGFGLSFLLYPLAGTVAALFALRVLFGLASTCHTAGGPTKFIDYPDNASRGRFVALVMVIMAVLNVVLVGAVGARLPGWLRHAGTSTAMAGSVALWIAAGLALGTALLAGFGLMRDVGDAPAPRLSPWRRMTAMFTGFGAVVAHARANPRFGTLLLTSFVIRTDTSIIQSFLALWVTAQGARQGIDTLAALRIAGTLAAIISGVNLFLPPLMGWLLDRYSRVHIYVAAISAVGVVFLCAPLVTDVAGWGMYALALGIGLAESAQTISQQALFGQEAPPHLRGTAYGLLAFFGSFSVVIIAFVAGQMFDRMGPTAPFTLTGGLHLVFAALSLGLLLRAMAAGRGARALTVGLPG